MTSYPNKGKIGSAAEETEARDRTELEGALVKKDKKSMPQTICDTCLEGIKLFKTPDNVTYAAIKRPGKGLVVIEVMSTAFKQELVYRYDKLHGKVVNAAAVKEARNTIDARARHDADTHVLHNRVAWDGENILYDMSNDTNECARITPNGWDIIQQREPVFKRWNHHEPQVQPMDGGCIDRIFDVVNVAEDDRLMYKVHLITSLIPGIAHPVTDRVGEHGSAKSAEGKISTALIDPSVLDVPNLPSEESNLVRTLSKHWYLVFDNVSWIHDWQSDTFCRASTGQAAAYRALYTDNDDKIYKNKMCVCFNGISGVATRADLLDRLLTIHLEAIPVGRRMEESAVNKRFDEVRPQVLGGMFDALSKAIKIYPDIVLDVLPRMADFARWGEAVARAMGYKDGEFITAYNKQIEDSNYTAIESVPVAGLIIDLVANIPAWNGTTGELYDELLTMAQIDGMPIDAAKKIPGLKSARSLGKVRERIAPNLRKIGIDWAHNRRTKGMINTVTKNVKPVGETTGQTTF